jgi:hypothetical protein
MKKSQLFHVLALCAVMITAQLAFSQAKIPFSFTLNGNVSTSAGVYTKNGVLVKTLWSGVQYKAGTYTQFWDGKDDDGRLPANDSFEMRVLSNSVNYQWEGVIGNTSSASSESTVHHAFRSMYGIAFAGNNGYYTTDYNEAQAPIFTFNISSPQSKTAILDNGCVTDFVATDGNYVYWDGKDARDTAKTFVYATKVSDNTEVTNFSNGSSVSATYARTYLSAIDVNYNIRSKVTGMAVQHSGNYLFVSRGRMNQIDVLNKTSGALVRTISMTTPTGLAIDTTDNLWVINGDGTSKYTVNSDGTLSSATITLSGLVAPIALAVNPDNSAVVVCDGGTSQQLKAYSNSTGASSWTYGQIGGYARDPSVTNDKFFFSDMDGARAFINFAQDGSFWVGDPGNTRMQHFSSIRTYIERIMFLPHAYSSVVDQNNSTRVFADFLEFSVDYSKTLGPNNGSWTLVKNWGLNVDPAYTDEFFLLRYLTTLSNGHTYAFLRHINNLALVELPASGNIRYTGIEINNLSCQIQPDGSLLNMSGFAAGVPTKWTKQTLSGFDESNNPLWNDATIIATSTPATLKNPVDFGVDNSVITSSNVLVTFDAGLPPYGSSGYHLGGITIGDNKWLWRTAKSTFKEYTGVYPSDGTYDIGNGVAYAGSHVRVLGRSILWGYHGEFWKNSQVNKWTQVYDDGLFIGQFGVTGLDSKIEAAPMMAGNAFCPSLVSVNGNGYLYVNDESFHSGVHRWKISGINSITEQKIQVSLSSIGQGLQANYFEGTDLNSLNNKLTRVDTVINLITNTIPSNLSNKSNFSTRWTGFIKPAYSEIYTIYTTANNGVRLWLNDTLLIDKWNNTSLTEYSTNLNLVAGLQYPIKIEYYNSGTPTAILSWSSANQPKQIVPSVRLTPSTEMAADTIGGFDLMQGLPFKSILSNNLYGWKRNPVNEDLTNLYSQWWSSTSGYKTYDQFKSPDVYAIFTQNTGTSTITRDLGSNNGVNSWKLSGVINYNGNMQNDPDGKGGMYMEVLDKAGKIITRFYANYLYNSVDPIITIYANNKTLTQGSRSLIDPVMYSSQPIEIKAVNNGAITFTYGPYAPVTATVFDTTSNWQNPQTLRLNFFGNSSNYGRIIDLESMRFSLGKSAADTIKPPIDSTIIKVPVDSTAAPVGGGSTTAPVDSTGLSKLSQLILYPNPVKNILHVQYPLVYNKAYMEIIASDGKKLKQLPLSVNSNSILLDVSFLPPGTYFLTYHNEPTVITKAFVK